MNEKQLLHEMKKKKDMAPYLSEYTKRYASLYYSYASIQLAFSYYTLYEVISEERVDWAEDKIDTLNVCLGLEGEEAIEKLTALRNDTMKVMDDVTAYTDLLSVYEHILNRVEYRFKDVTVPDLSVASTRMQQFIFADKDAMVTNEKIKAIVSELPLRMTKQRFYDILTDSLGIYKESDEAGVEGFLYQIRTVAGLREEFPQMKELSFVSEVLSKCQEADFSAMTQAEFEQLSQTLKNTSDFLVTMVNVYMQIQECVNHYYTMQLCAPYVDEKTRQETSYQASHAMVMEIHDHFGEDASIVLDRCNEYLEALEGKQESLMERVMGFEALFPDVEAAFADDAAVKVLNQCLKLVSSSIFIDLESDFNSPAATSAFIEEKTKNLIEEFQTFFKKHDQIVNRAVMSMVLGAVPVFFNNTDEIIAYIEYALEHCNDEKELCASLDLIKGMME